MKFCNEDDLPSDSVSFKENQDDYSRRTQFTQKQTKLVLKPAKRQNQNHITPFPLKLKKKKQKNLLRTSSCYYFLINETTPAIQQIWVTRNRFNLTSPIPTEHTHTFRLFRTTWVLA